MNNAFKRFASFMLALLMVISALPLSALAVAMLDTTVLNGKIAVTSDGVSKQGSGVVNEDGTITVTTKATANCKGTSYSYTANAHTILVTNKTADEDLMVEFAYDATGLGTLTIDGVAKTSTPNGTYSKSLAAGESVTIVITSPASGSSGTGATATIVLSNFELKDTSAKNVTVMKMDGGTTTVNGTALSDASTTVNTDYATGVTVKAAPASGYVFLGWVDADGNVLSTKKEDTIHPLANMTVGAAFVANDAQGYWLGGGKLHTDLNEACAAAEADSEDKQVVMLKSATLSSGTYTIPRGVSLLIPKDEALTTYGANPSLAANGEKWVAPTAYVTLTLGNGANLVVNGTMELAAMHYIATGSGTNNANLFGGAINGSYGHVAMKSGSKLTVNGTLYAWGIVSGSGEVIANNGAEVYEKMQITDYRGGGATSAVVSQTSKKAFPFNQYYVQNIEVKETIHYGATVYIHAGVYASGPEASSVAFVGTGTSAMFGLEPGSYIIKDYDESSDRLVVDLYGSGSLNPIALTFSGQTVNSSSFRLGINNNIDIGVHSGVVKITQNIVLQPGATVSVDKDATLFIPDGVEVFVLDQEDWGNFARSSLIIPVYWSYANGRQYVRSASTVNDLNDAKVDVNGTVIAEGKVYTSGSQSVISSEKTGVYALLAAAPTNSTVYQVTGTDTLSIYGSGAWTSITVTSSDLVNGDNSVTATSSGAQYDAFIYDTFQDKWIQQNIFNGGAGYIAKLIYNADDGTETPATYEEQSVDYFANASAFMGSNFATMNPFYTTVLGNDVTNFTREGYDFAGWSLESASSAATAEEPAADEPAEAAESAEAAEPAAEDTREIIQPGKLVTISADTTLYAKWNANSYNLYFEEADGMQDQKVAYGTDLSTILTEPKRDGYKFTGWTFTKTGDNSAIETAPTTMPAYDITATANWAKAFTLKFLDENGDVLKDADGNELVYLYEAGETVTATYPEYTKDGQACTWSVQEIPATLTGDLEIQAIFTKYYTLTFKDENGNVMKDAEGKELVYTYAEGEPVTATYPTYTKENYTISWSAQEIPATLTDNLEISAIATPNVYAITFYNGETNCGEAAANVDNGWKATIIGNLTGDAHNKFLGWSATKGGAVDTRYTADAQIALSDDMDLFAVWETTQCADTDNDHICNTEGCGKPVSVCKDNLTAHAEDPATCLENGTMAYWSCNVCGKNYLSAEAADEAADEDLVIPAKGHTFGKTVEAKAATCLAVGNEAYKQCETCGKYFAADADKNSTEGKDDTTSFVIAQKQHSYTGAIKSDGDGKDATHSFLCENGCNQYGGADKHTWGEGIVNPDSTCLGEGTKTYTCTVDGCGANYTETVNAKGHSFGETVEAKAATCLAAGNDAYKQCTVCDLYFAADAENNAAGGADNADGFVIDALGHDLIIYEANAATCLAAGNDAYMQCTQCELYFTTDAGIYAENGAATNEAFIKEQLSHSYTGEYQDNGDGTHSRKCINGCEGYGEATAHTWNDGVETTAPDCLGAGVKTYTCTAEKCGATYTETVNAKGHSFGTTTAAKAATCTEAGNSAYKQCETCGKFFAGNAETNATNGSDNADGFVIPAKGHTFGATTPAKAATCTEAGNSAYKQCTVCKLYFAGNAETNATDGKEKAEAFAIEKDLSNHTKAIDYKAITDTQHTAYYPCCEAEIETVNHTYVDGYCACNKAKTIPVTVILEEDQMGVVNITLNKTTATFGQNFVATVTADKGTGIAFTGTNAAVQHCTFDEKTRTLTIPAEAITAEMETINVHFMATVQYILDVNGGVISDQYRQDIEKKGDVIDGDRIITREPYGITFELMQWPEHLVSKIGHTNNGAIIQDGTYYPIGTRYTVLDDMTLTFQWEPKTYTVTWTVNGEPYGQPTSVKFGEEFPAPDYVVPEGYSFSGWDVPATMPAENLTLDATLALKTYTVTWNVDGTITEETYTHGATINLPTEPVKDGYRFEGWNGYTEDMTATTDVTITAKFEKLYYVTYLSYDINKDVYVEDWKKDAIEGEKITLGNYPYKYANTLGWDINDDGTVDYDYWAEYTMPAKDVTMKPVLQPFYGDVELGAEDATFTDASGNSITRIFASGVYHNWVDSTDIPVREGYRFLGWQDPAYGLHKVMTNEEGKLYVPLSFTANTTLTAQWAKLYTVTFTVDDQQIASAEYVEDETIAVPETPTKDAVGCTTYTFSGWTDAEGNDAEIPATMPAKDLTFTASFTENTVHSDEVKYVDNGNGTHDGTCAACGEHLGHHLERPHDYTSGTTEHTCICGDVKAFTIKFYEYKAYIDLNMEPFATITADFNSDISDDISEIEARYRAENPGLTLKGWFDAESNTETVVALNPMPGKDMTVIPDVRYNTYYITWMVDGKQYDNKTEVRFNNNFILPANPTKTNYTFLHWEDKDGKKLETRTAESGNIIATDNYKIAGDSTYYAVFTPNEYTITFGKETLTANEDNNWKVTVPSASKTGFEFKGWATTENATEPDYRYPVGAEVAFTESMTLYPVFKANTYTLTVDMNGGTIGGQSTYTVTAAFESEVPYPTQGSLAPEGYELKGWKVTINGEERDDLQTRLPITMLAADATYTAQWKLKTVSVTFQDTELGTEETVSGEYFGTATAPAPEERVGYDFLGWAETADPKAAIVFEGGATITLNDSVNGKTYYAKWEAKTYKITWDLDGGEYTGTSALKTSAKYGDFVSLDLRDVLVKEGYNFAGLDSEDVEIHGDTFKEFDMPAKDVTLKVLWEIKEYQITWLDEEGNFLAETWVEYNKMPACPADKIPTKEADAQYTYTLSWTPAIVEATGPATYTATFTPVLRSYDITFVVDGELYETVSVSYGHTPSVENPTKADTAEYTYTFAGWADAEGNKVDTLPTVTGEATYTATWTETERIYTVTFLVNNETWFYAEGKYGEAIDYESGDGFSDPVETGYSFAWDKEKPETFTENVTIIGTFTINQYTITFMDGEKVMKEITADYGTEIDFSFTDDAKTGYKLDQWVSKDGNTVYSFDTIPAEDLTVYATWQKCIYKFSFYNGSVAEDNYLDYYWFDYEAKYDTMDAFVAATNLSQRIPEGYKIVGLTYADGTELVFPYTQGTSGADVIVKLEGIPYTVTFKDENGGELGSITAPYGSNIADQVAAITATKEGYNFNCWMNNGKCVILETMPLNGMTVTADFTVNEYNVNFFATEGDTEAVKTFKVEYGTDLNGAEDDPETEEDESMPNVFADLLAQVADPTKEGHDWQGWDTSKVPATMPAEAVNIYGTWRVQQYVLEIKNLIAGGEQVNYFDWVLYGTSYESAEALVSAFGSNSALNPYGYTFNGLTYEDGTAVTWPFVMPANKVVLKANYSINSYTITFDTVGGVPETIDSITADYRDAITWPENPTKEGHTFQGWSTDGETVMENLPESMPVGGLNLKAVWQKNTVYIDWIIEGVKTTQTYQYGDTITAPTATKAADEKYTYKFIGWDDEIPATATTGATYTAVFAEDEAVKYTVKFVNGETTVHETQIAWNGQVELDKLEGFTAPVLEHNTLSWTVDGAEVTFPYAMSTKPVTFVAKWTPKTYTIKFYNNASDTEPVHTISATCGTAISYTTYTAPAGYSFEGWTLKADNSPYTLPEKMPGENLELVAINNPLPFTVTFFEDEIETQNKTVKYLENVLSVIGQVEPAAKGEGYTFLGWYDEAKVKLDEAYTMPAQDVNFYANWSFTGWQHDYDADGEYIGTTYVKNNELLYWSTWAEIEGSKYYFDADGYIVKDITLIGDSYYAFDHDTGKFLSELTGIYEALNGDLYYVENGVAVKNKGLVRTFQDGGHIHYYYFGCGANGCSAENCAGEYRAQKGNRHWVEFTNEYLLKGGYTFGEDGVIEHTDDTNRQGIQTIDGVKYYLMDGVKVPKGLFMVGEDYYYASSSGALVVDRTYWVSAAKINGLGLEPGNYKFNEEGRIVFSEKNGFYFENGAWFYYEDGVPCYKGLHWFDGKTQEGWEAGPTLNDPGYYYINSSAKLIVNCDYWISKNNGYMKNKTYTFDENGTMVIEQVELKNGFYWENGAWFYYENDVKTYAGLIWCDGPEGNDPGYYYVNSSCRLVTGCDYWISKNNGHMNNMTYTFDENGTMITPAPVEPDQPDQPDVPGHALEDNIRIGEDGEWYYFVDGVKTYAGLILAEDGNYYYVNSSGKIVRNGSYWISKNNGYMKNRSYTFDANGVMTNPQPIA